MKEISRTGGICPVCSEVVPARILETDGRVFMANDCPSHGTSESLISSDAAWYRRTMQFMPKAVKPALVKPSDGKGCPRDCGHCGNHMQRMYLPVVPVTSACNLNCPVCYTINKNRDAYFMSEDEFGRVLDHIRKCDPEMQIINFTGGEPLLHPRLPRLVEMCRDAGIQRITVSTNGLRFLEDPGLLPVLTELDARIVLSFNSFKAVPYRITAGKDLIEKKMKVLEQLDRYRPSTSLLAVAALGVNDSEIGKIARYVLESDYMVSMEIHTVTFTGQNAGRFDASTRITTPDVLKSIAKANPGVRVEDFLPSPCAHPLCYSVCCFLRLSDGGAVPFTEFISEAEMIDMLEGSLYIEPGMDTERILTEAMNNLWSRETPGDRDQEIMDALGSLLREMFPRQGLGREGQRKVAEKYTKAIYVHSHMDAGNLDTERLKYCCGAVPDGEGGSIPTCAYNNFYRSRDERFQEAVRP